MAHHGGPARHARVAVARIARACLPLRAGARILDTFAYMGAHRPHVTRIAARLAAAHLDLLLLLALFGVEQRRWREIGGARGGSGVEGGSRFFLQVSKLLPKGGTLRCVGRRRTAREAPHVAWRLPRSSTPARLVAFSTRSWPSADAPPAGLVGTASCATRGRATEAMAYSTLRRCAQATVMRTGRCATARVRGASFRTSARRPSTAARAYPMAGPPTRHCRPTAAGAWRTSTLSATVASASAGTT